MMIFSVFSLLRSGLYSFQDSFAKSWYNICVLPVKE